MDNYFYGKLVYRYTNYEFVDMHGPCMYSETNIVDNNFSLIEKIQANTYKDVESGAILTDILQPEIPKTETYNGQSKPRTIKLYGVCDLVLANKEELNNKVMKKEL